MSEGSRIDTLWTWERDGDARWPVPEIGEKRWAFIERVDGDSFIASQRRAFRQQEGVILLGTEPQPGTTEVMCVAHGTLRTHAGGNDRACAWVPVSGRWPK